jgi:hypothetical protein
VDGFGLVIGFIEHLQIVTISNYKADANSHTLQFTTACTKSSQYLHQLSPGNSFLSFHVHVLTGWWLSHNLPPTLLSAISRLACIHSFSTLCSLSTDRIESTSLNSCIVTSHSYRTDRVENIASQLLHCSVLRICCLATGVVWLLISLLPSNRSTCHIAPSLRLFILNSLQVYRHFFFCEGCACDICAQPHLPTPWVSFHGDYSQLLPLLPS